MTSRVLRFPANARSVPDVPSAGFPRGANVKKTRQFSPHVASINQANNANAIGDGIDGMNATTTTAT